MLKFRKYKIIESNPKFGALAQVENQNGIQYAVGTETVKFAHGEEYKVYLVWEERLFDIKEQAQQLYNAMKQNSINYFDRLSTR